MKWPIVPPLGADQVAVEPGNEAYEVAYCFSPLGADQVWQSLFFGCGHWSGRKCIHLNGQCSCLCTRALTCISKLTQRS